MLLSLCPTVLTLTEPVMKLKDQNLTVDDEVISFI